MFLYVVSCLPAYWFPPHLRASYSSVVLHVTIYIQCDVANIIRGKQNIGRSSHSREQVTVQGRVMNGEGVASKVKVNPIYFIIIKAKPSEQLQLELNKYISE